MRITFVMLLLFVAASTCIGAENRSKADEDNIREAVLRYQFDHNASALQKSAEVYFIGFGQKAADPSDNFMKRFADNKPPVRKSSDSHFVRGKGLLEKKTGKKGLEFSAITIKWISDTEVEVEGGYFEAELSSS